MSAAAAPIDLYTWPTPNGWKVHIILEELEVPYTVHAVNIMKGDQFEADFLAISPNNKMPAIVDPDGPDGKPFSVFESGAILIYLAEKYRRFLPEDPAQRSVTLQWLMFQMGGLGPMLGQAHHFRQYAPERIDYAYDRYTNEAKRLYKVVNKRLSEARYLAGDAYTIADMAAFPWLRLFKRQGVEEADIPHVKRYIDEMYARPAVQRGLAVLAEERKPVNEDETARNLLFGKGQLDKAGQ